MKRKHIVFFTVVVLVSVVAMIIFQMMGDRVIRPEIETAPRPAQSAPK